MLQHRLRLVFTAVVHHYHLKLRVFLAAKRLQIMVQIVRLVARTNHHRNARLHLWLGNNALFLNS